MSDNVVAENVVMTPEDIDAALFDMEATPVAEPVSEDGEASEAKPKRQRKPKAEKAPKEPKAPNPYAGLSNHQRNRRIALAKYGTREGYEGNDFQVKIEPETRAKIEEVLNQGKVRPSAKGKSHGGDRYLIQLSKMGWPEGVATIIYGDEIVAARAERLAEREKRAEEVRLAKEARKAEDAERTEKTKKQRKAKASKAEDVDVDVPLEGDILGEVDDFSEV